MNRRQTMRSNFAWSFVGSVVYSLVLWVLVVMLARLGSNQMVGQFALAQAISAPIFLTVGLNLRVVRATDVRRVWSSAQYSKLRLGLNGVCLLGSLAGGLVFGMRGQELAVLAMVGLGKSSEATSQVLYGFFQIRDRLDLVAGSLLLRALLGSVMFLLGLVLTGSLLVACAGLAVGWLSVYVAFDRRKEKMLLTSEPPPREGDERKEMTVWSLARKAAPLGADAGVSSVATNTPRFAVQSLLGTAQLGNFVALAYLGQVVALVTGSLANSLIGPLARMADRGDARAFMRLLWKLVGFGLAVSAVAVLGALVVGAPVIRLVIGPDYVNQPVLVTLMVSASLITIQRCLGRGLQAGHVYKGVLVVDVVTLVATVAAAVVLIPEFGLVGAAATLGVGFAAGCVVSWVLLMRLVGRMQTNSPTADHRLEVR